MAHLTPEEMAAPHDLMTPEGVHQYLSREIALLPPDSNDGCRRVSTSLFRAAIALIGWDHPLKPVYMMELWQAHSKGASLPLPITYIRSLIKYLGPVINERAALKAAERADAREAKAEAREAKAEAKAHKDEK